MKSIMLVTCLACVLGLTACQDTRGREIGTITGAGVGAAAGNLMGGGALGTVGGAVAGGVAGHYIGKSMEKK